MTAAEIERRGTGEPRPEGESQFRHFLRELPDRDGGRSRREARPRDPPEGAHVDFLRRDATPA